MSRIDGGSRRRQAAKVGVATHHGMVVISAGGYLGAGGHDDHTFRARQGLVYSIEEVPGDDELQRTDLHVKFRSP